MSPIDPTVVIERMARRLRSEGASHPVAAAVSLAARGHACLSLHEFADAIDLSAEVVRSAELGSLAFGDLPAAIGKQAAETGADLLALADLEAEWRLAAESGGAMSGRPACRLGSRWRTTD